MKASTRRSRRQPLPRAKAMALPTLSPNAAGLDIGSAEIWAAVPTNRDSEPVRPFGTFTPDLNALANWLQACEITTVAMESTGVYWIPIFEILEARGFQVYLVNARHLKNVPGRKTDVLDCQWIQYLHSVGLLSGSFRPDAEMCALRAYLRHRANLLESRAAHIQHMQKALQQMNVQLTQVLSDITGETGLAILRKILAGDRDPVALAQLRDPRCRSTQAEIAKALTGNYRPEHVFALKQALALYDFYTAQVSECDTEIERQYSALKPVVDPEQAPLPPSTKTNSHCKNAPDFDVRRQLYRVTGVDLTAVDGLNEGTSQIILSEIGTDMSKWRTDKHFCSWLHLAPHNDISGGKILRSRILKGRNRAVLALRMAAQSVGRTQTGLGAYYRRMHTKFGPERAVVATAHKIARIIYHMLKDGKPYQAMGSQEYERRHRERDFRQLKRRAAKLGFILAPQPAEVSK
jgi:transposase